MRSFPRELSSPWCYQSNEMTDRYKKLRRQLGLLVALMGTAAYLRGQPETLVIDPKKPLVFISFNRVAGPQSASKGEDSGRLWLRIENNSRVPIEVLARQVQPNADGLEVAHEVVKASDLNGYPSGPTPSASGWISPPERNSPIPIDVATAVRINSGSDLLFRVPLNHVGPSWYLQLRFQFLFTALRSGRQPQGIVDFTWADIPASERRAWKADSRK
jgi:hypothetical protein